jgi:hypothetical protein
MRPPPARGARALALAAFVMSFLETARLASAFGERERYR